MPGTIYDYFVRACQREITLPSERGVSGATIQGSDDNRARFWIGVEGDRIVSVDYGSTSCTTLLAICEHIAELTTGQDLGVLAGVTVERMLELHPEIAPSKRESVRTAVRALQSAARRLSRSAE